MKVSLRKFWQQISSGIFEEEEKKRKCVPCWRKYYRKSNSWDNFSIILSETLNCLLSDSSEVWSFWQKSEEISWGNIRQSFLSLGDGIFEETSGEIADNFCQILEISDWYYVFLLKESTKGFLKEILLDFLAIGELLSICLPSVWK